MANSKYLKMMADELCEKLEEKIRERGYLLLWTGEQFPEGAGVTSGLHFGSNLTKRSLLEALLEYCGYKMQWVKE